MHHNPGIRIMDLDKLVIPHNPEVVILTLGRLNALHVDPNLKSYLLFKGVARVEILESQTACKLYNEIYNKQRVVALIHTTC
jgi:hypothetical protein